jgi:hypothetical protein
LLDLLGVAPVFALCAAIQTGVMALVAVAALRARVPDVPEAREAPAEAA